MADGNYRITRRQCLIRCGQSTLGIGLAGLLSSCSIGQKCETKPGSRMKFGLVTYLWGQDWDLPTLIRNCEQTGVPGVELRTQHAHGVEANLNPQERKDVRKRFADTRVICIGLGTNFEFHSPDPTELKKNIDGAKEYIKLASDVGASGIKVKPNTLPDGVPAAKTIEQIGRSLNELGRFAADFGQQVRLEVHGDKTQELPIIRQIMDVANHPSVKVCWNSNEQDLNGQGLEYNFNLVKDRFGATVHVRELDDASYPYQKLMNLLVKMDYGGWVMLEGRTNPPDRVKALLAQRLLFEQMLKKAQAAL